MDFDNVMSELDGVFREVEKSADSFENLPDGKYLGTLESVEYKESRKGKPMLVFAFKVTEGDHKGQKQNRYMMLSSYDQESLQTKLRMLAYQLKTLGIDTSKGLQESLDDAADLAGTQVVATVSTDTTGKYHNISFELAEKKE